MKIEELESTKRLVDSSHQINSFFSDVFQNEHGIYELVELVEDFEQRGKEDKAIQLLAHLLPFQLEEEELDQIFKSVICLKIMEKALKEMKKLVNWMDLEEAKSYMNVKRIVEERMKK